MRTSVMISNFSWRGPIDEELAHVAAMADEAAIDSVFVADHLVQSEPGTEPSEPMLEALTTLGHLAARTTQVRLGTMVASVTLRPAALLVKAVTTLDVLSHGRAWFGIGAGYQQADADAMGVALPAVGERFDALEDALQLARRMWSADDTPFDGHRLHAGRPIGSPVPTTAPHPPILIGGTGERRTLRLVARYADACNLPDVPDGGELIRHKLAVLAEHCRAERRPFDAIEKTVSTRLEPGQPAAAFVERAAALAALGLDHLVVLTRGPWTVDSLAVLARAVPDITAIPASAPADAVVHDNSER
jgi:alkanesulfonate monooxygenase SsuD/methylene tetrahydromethanopterin reductase-like flavin-dependent oxidoreductase (luciferase family)